MHAHRKGAHFIKKQHNRHIHTAPCAGMRWPTVSHTHCFYISVSSHISSSQRTAKDIVAMKGKQQSLEIYPHPGDKHHLHNEQSPGANNETAFFLGKRGKTFNIYTLYRLFCMIQYCGLSRSGDCMTYGH